MCLQSSMIKIKTTELLLRAKGGFLGTLSYNSTSRNQVGSIALPLTMCDSKKQTALANNLFVNQRRTNISIRKFVFLPNKVKSFGLRKLQLDSVKSK